MPVESHTFRLFVSSTFEDLIDERDALQREVFPRIRELCGRHGARFQAIDLRWGVREEAAADHRTMEICLGEINRCRRTGLRPSLLVLLGDRYGWRPVPARVPESEFAQVRGPLAAQWYELDVNASPPEFLLKRRTPEFPEVELHEELRQGALRAGFSPDVLLRYEGSAVHQEIIEGLGTTAADRDYVVAFCRRQQAGTPQDSELAALKRLLPDITYFDSGGLSEFCERVHEKIERVILRELGRFGARPPLTLEIEAHDRYGRESAQPFVGRDDVLREIRQYLESDDRRVLVLYGPSGSGKSAVMARSSLGVDAVRRFVGATPESGNAATLLRGLCHQMGNAAPGLHLPELAASFRECLTRGKPGQPLVLFLDGLDQLEDVTWLPAVLPPHCRVVISTVVRPAAGRSFELNAMGPSEGADLFQQWLDVAHRKVSDEQKREVLSAFQRSGLPLYLRLAFEEARLWRSFDSPRLGEGLEGMLARMTARLADHSNHGPVLTAHGLGYLTAARDGLTEDEVIDLLSDDDAVRKDFEARAKHPLPGRPIPVIVWLRLLMDLEPYLVEIGAPGGTVVTWQHGGMREWFAAQCEGENADFRPHRVLAEYFDVEDSPLWQSHAKRVPNYRKLRELAYQQTLSGMRKELGATLGDVAFLEAKSAAEMGYDLLADCERAAALVPAASVLKAALGRAVRALQARPDHILQTLYNQLVWMGEQFPGMRRSLEQAIQTLDRRGPWLQLESRPAYDSGAGSVSYKMPFGSAVQAVSAHEDLLAWVRYDGMLSAHRMSTGQKLFERSLPSSKVAGISISNGRTAAYVDRTGTIGVEGNPRTLAGRPHERLVFYDGQWVLAVREDHALVAWSAADGRCVVLHADVPEPLAILRPTDGGSVFCIAGVREQSVGVIRLCAEGCSYEAIPYQGSQIVDADLVEETGLIVAACADRSLRVLDAATAREIGALDYQRLSAPVVPGRVECCCFGRGGAMGRAFFATSDSQIGAWDWETGIVELISSGVPEGGSHAYSMLRGLASGKVLATRLEDVTLLGPVAAAPNAATHQRPVDTVEILVTGQVVSFSAGDRSVIWHSEGGDEAEWRQNILHATAMTVLPGTSDVVVADSRGAVWRVRPGEPAEPEGAFSTEGVAALCATGSGLVAVGAASGSILWVDPEAKVAARVRPAVWGVKQIGLIAAGRSGCCWTREVVTKTGGTRAVLALVSKSGRERCKFEVQARAVAVGDDGGLLCYADESAVHVRRRLWFWFFPAYKKVTQATQIAMMDGAGLLAVACAEDSWLELWRIASGLPEVTAADLPDSPTCMAVRGDRIALGFSSGEVRWFRFRKGMGA